jgi:hypothetical protein
LCDAERGLLLAALVAVDLAEVDAGGGCEPGLGQAGFLAQAADDRAEVGLFVVGFQASVMIRTDTSLTS